MTGIGISAARRMSSCSRRLRGQVRSWRPARLHWRRTPRPRATDRDRVLGGWTSILALRIPLHFSSCIKTAGNSTLLATARLSREMWNNEIIRTLRHRETLREYATHVHLVPRPVVVRSSAPLVDFPRLARTQKRAVAAYCPRFSLRGPSVRTVIATVRATGPATRISNRFASHAHYTVSSSSVRVSTGVIRERKPQSRELANEPVGIIHRTELVWRHQPAAAKDDAPAFRPNLAETPARSEPAAFESASAREPAAAISARAVTPVFDAPQMDRLVDNVIQRVEKRVRIERERRGW